MDSPDDFRRLAEWYRGWAKVGGDHEAGWRRRFADHLDRKARELEEAAAPKGGDSSGRIG